MFAMHIDHRKTRIILVLGLCILSAFFLGFLWQTSEGHWLNRGISIICETQSFSFHRNKTDLLDGLPEIQLPSFPFHRNKTDLLDGLPEIELLRMVYSKPHIFKPPRTDVLTVTPWLAPIIWEGTFNLDILNEQFRQRNATVGLTVFAIKKYVVFLQKFLETAETYFMVGHRVKYYIFTDRPEDVPNITVKAEREMIILKVQNYPRWQEISMRRMEMISYYSQQRFIHEVDFLVCVDADMQFNDHVGVEILSEIFGTIHPGFYASERKTFSYERRPESEAYIPPDEGDFYYMGSIFGGTVAGIYKLTKKCHEAIMADKKKNLEAVWQEESHLNKYFVYHKPTKVLSPEYMWDNDLGSPQFLRKKRFLAVPKNHAAIRNKRNSHLKH